MDDKKILAFIVKIIIRLIFFGRENITECELQQLENIAADIGSSNLSDDEFINY